MNHRLDKAFNGMIKMAGLDHLPENSTQIIEMRRAFFGGAATMFVVMTEDVPMMSREEDAIDLIQEYANEIDNFVAGLEIGER